MREIDTSDSETRLIENRLIFERLDGDRYERDGFHGDKSHGDEFDRDRFEKDRRGERLDRDRLDTLDMHGASGSRGFPAPVHRSHRWGVTNLTMDAARIACGGQELRATTGWPRIYSETVLFLFFAVDELEELSSLWIFNRSRSLLI